MFKSLKESIENLLYESDYDTVLREVAIDGYYLSHTTRQLANDPVIVQKAIEQTSSAIIYAGKQAQDNEDIILYVVKDLGSLLQYASERLRNDKYIVKTAIESSAYAFEYASETLRDNKEMLDLALSRSFYSLHSSIFKHAGYNLKHNKAYVLEWMKKYNIFPHLPEVLKKDKDVIEALCLYHIKSSLDFENLAKEIEYTTDILITLLKNRQHTYVFDYLPHTLKNNPAFLLHILELHPNIFYKINPQIIHDIQFIKQALSINGNLLQYVSTKIQDNIPIVKIALKQNPMAIQYASQRIKSNKNIAISVLKKKGFSYEFIDSSIKDDELLYIALHDNDVALKFHPHYDFNHRLDNKELVLKLLQQRGRQDDFFKYISLNLLEDRDIVEQAITLNGLLLDLFSPKWRADYHIAKLAVQQNGLALQYLDVQLRNEQEIVFLALEQNIQAKHYIGFKLAAIFGNNDPLVFLRRKKLAEQLTQDLEIKTQHLSVSKKTKI